MLCCIVKNSDVALMSCDKMSTAVVMLSAKYSVGENTVAEVVKILFKILTFKCI